MRRAASRFGDERAKVDVLWLALFLWRRRKDEEGVEDMRHATQLLFDRPGVRVDLFIFTAGKLRDAHAQELEVEHSDIQRRLEIMRGIAAAAKVCRRKTVEPGVPKSPPSLTP